MDSSSARSLTGSDLHSLVLKDTRNPGVCNGGKPLQKEERGGLIISGWPPSNPSLKERPQMCEASNDFSRLGVPPTSGFISRSHRRQKR